MTCLLDKLDTRVYVAISAKVDFKIKAVKTVCFKATTYFKNDRKKILISAGLVSTNPQMGILRRAHSVSRVRVAITCRLLDICGRNRRMLALAGRCATVGGDTSGTLILPELLAEPTAVETCWRVPADRSSRKWR